MHRTVRRQGGANLRLDVPLQQLDGLAKGELFGRADVQSDGSVPVDAPQAARAHGGLHMHQFAQGHDAAVGCRDGGIRQRLRRVPLAGAQDHVEPAFAVEVLAHEHAIAERPHHRADVAA